MPGHADEPRSRRSGVGRVQPRNLRTPRCCCCGRALAQAEPPAELLDQLDVDEVLVGFWRCPACGYEEGYSQGFLV